MLEAIERSSYFSLLQILLARRIGKTRIIAETGAGQHGVATATVCARFGMECIIYMGEEDCRRQALNVFRIRMLGGKVRASSCFLLHVPSLTENSFRSFQCHQDQGLSRTLSTKP